MPTAQPTITFDANLPISAAVDEIRDLIERNQVVVVAGETGSGKTTQLPKIALLAGRKRTDAITIPVGSTLRQAEMELIEATLDSTGGDKEIAAQILGIAARTIYRKVK